MMEFAIAVSTILIVLLLAFLGDRTAAGLQKLARDWKEYKEQVDKGTNDSDDSREALFRKENGQ